MNEVTRILSKLDQGDPRATADLLALVYDELHQLAAQKMRDEAPDHTLQATALVHEAYLRLVAPEDQPQWSSRGHFFCAAAEAMRRILVESARRKHALRRGGDRSRVDLSLVEPAVPARSDELLALDDALEKLERQDAVKANLIKLRYFAGFTMEDASQALGISPATAYRHWNYARAWLHQEVSGAIEIPQKSD